MLAGNFQGGEKLLTSKWIHFIDSGGQPEFHDLLPVFVPNASVMLFVFNLSEGEGDTAIRGHMHALHTHAPTHAHTACTWYMMVKSCLTKLESHHRVIIIHRCIHLLNTDLMHMM